MLEPVATDHQEPAVRESTETTRTTRVPAKPILDPQMSAKAIGLYTKLMTLDLDGPTTVAKIAERFPDGEAAVKSGLNELESRGYLTREVQRDGVGRRTGVKYTLHAEPQEPPARHTA